MVTNETEQIGTKTGRNVYTRSQFMDNLRTAGLGAIFGLLSGTSLASLALELSRQKNYRPETDPIFPVIVYKTDNLSSQATKEFDERFDSLLANMKQSGAENIDQLPDSHQGLQFTLENRTYSLATVARNVRPLDKSVVIFNSSKILGISTQEGSLFFVIDQNQFITAIQRKPLSTPTMDSIRTDELSIDSDNAQSIKAFENYFEKWKNSKSPNQPPESPTPEPEIQPDNN